MPDTPVALWVLIGLVLINTVLRLVSQASDRVLARQVGLVLDALMVWADTWGQPAEVVKGALQQKLYGRRKTDPPRRVDDAVGGG